MKVLIVDDAMFMRLSLKKLLLSEGMECFEAGNGLEAVQLYQECRPDLVTMDITMPEMDGISAVREIRNFDPDATIVMCSAMGEQAKVLAAIEAGAKDFIVKPFKPERVLEAIRQATKRSA